MPRNGAPTRQRILDAAERLVIDNGFAATPVDAVIAAADTSKGAFFHHFASKADLALALVQRYADADVAHLRSALDAARASSTDPAHRVVAFVRVFEDSAEELMSAQSSCLYVSILTEQQLVLDGTAAPIEAAILAWRTEFAELLRSALAEDVDVDALADHLFVTFEGAFVLCRSMQEPQHMRAQLSTYRLLLEALLRSSSRRRGRPGTMRATIGG